jgi:hypothetical protein
MERSGNMSAHTKSATERRQESRMEREMTFMIRRLEYPGRIAQAVDLSTGGMRFRYLGPTIPEGEEVCVQFWCREEPFSFFGRALRSTRLGEFGQDVALTFAGLDSETRGRLQACLAPAN